jgi:predicted DCC family thiol-disulfide oxidoreductase YuxK
MRRRAGVSGRLAAASPYSYRTDPNVPTFPDDRPLIVFDGLCVLCSAFVRFILRRDRNFAFRLTTAQSALGQALYRHYGLDTNDFETNLIIDAGRPWAKLDSVALAGRQLGGLWRALVLLRLLPRPIADWLYDRVARNRYSLFGRTDRCMVPAPAWRDRFIA